MLKPAKATLYWLFYSFLEKKILILFCVYLEMEIRSAIFIGYIKMNYFF